MTLTFDMWTPDQDDFGTFLGPEQQLQLRQRIVSQRIELYTDPSLKGLPVDYVQWNITEVG